MEKLDDEKRGALMEIIKDAWENLDFSALFINHGISPTELMDAVEKSTKMRYGKCMEQVFKELVGKKVLEGVEAHTDAGGPSFVSVPDTLEEIQEKHDAVKEIEKELLDLHQISINIAVLVEALGEKLDNIGNQATNAVDHVQWGADALRTAESLQKSSGICMMIAIIFLLIIAIIIVKPWK